MPSPASGQLCTFWVADLYIGVDVMDVQEVIRYQEMTEVPLAPASVRGLINLRGQIVTAIDLRQQLELPPREDALPMNVVVRSGEDVLSLLVDEIGEVVEIHPQDRDVVPPTVRGVARDLFTATYKLPDRLLLALDITRAVAVDTAPTLLEGALT